MFNPENSIWTERFRPKQLKDVVGDFTDKITKHLVEPESLQNFLFHSKSPGTGKTTTAKAIINELGCDKLIINSSDDRKIEVIREKVKQFAMTKSTNDSVKRCIFLDEVDGMLNASQDALRNIMETYADNVFFILTCNNVNKVIEPIKSRCVNIAFAYPKKEKIAEYLVSICEKEDMTYTLEGITELIEANYPNIRNCVVSLQDLYVEKKDVIPDNITSTDEIFEVLWKKLLEKKWQDIKVEVMETTVDPRELNSYFWRRALEEERIKLIQMTCMNERDIALGADPKIILVTALVEMSK